MYRSDNTTRTAATVAAVLVAAIICIYYYFHDPSAGGAPRCMFRLLTGWDCPGCGSQRALHALLHGRVAQAWTFNPFLFFAVPAGVFYLVVETWRDRMPRLYDLSTRTVCIAAIAVAVVAWWVGRNVW